MAPAATPIKAAIAGKDEHMADNYGSRIGPPPGLGCTQAQLRRFIKSRAYVPMHAEEIQRTARRDGVTASQWATDALGLASGLLSAPKPSPVEVIGESHAARMHEACKPAAKRGRPPKFKAAADATPDLFGA